ncbi:VOC family protein [Catellatospora sp. NPDC049609]|uniref:VOC family protein n=1 Tax=Catellatospora sp. NPDC049609 TaxID=3155505 RepID=UPI00342A5DC0
MTEQPVRISPEQFHQAEGVDDWRVIGDGACAWFRTPSFAAGARLVQAISELPGGHSPDVDLRAGAVTVRLVTWVPGFFGMTEEHVELARQISAAARGLGLTADPSLAQNVQFCIDALDVGAVMPFWLAVLGYTERGDCPGDMIDPRHRGPLVYFQEMDAPRPQRNRVHLDIWVAHDQAEARVKAALEAGGRLVTDENAPSWWVLADAEGNECCIGTWLTRH